MTIKISPKRKIGIDKDELLNGLPEGSKVVGKKIIVETKGHKLISRLSELQLQNIGNQICIEMEFISTKKGETDKIEELELLELNRLALIILEKWQKVVLNENNQDVLFVSEWGMFLPFEKVIQEKYNHYLLNEIQRVDDKEIYGVVLSQETESKLISYVECKHKITNCLNKNEQIEIINNLDTNLLLYDKIKFQYCDKDIFLFLKENTFNEICMSYVDEGEIRGRTVDLNNQERMNEILEEIKEKNKLKYLINPPLLKLNKLIKRMFGGHNKIYEETANGAFECLSSIGYSWEEVESESVEILNNFNNDYPLVNLQELNPNHPLSSLGVVKQTTKRSDYYFLCFELPTTKVRGIPMSYGHKPLEELCFVSEIPVSSDVAF